MAYERELSTATAAAREAGDIMQRYQEDGFSVDRKKSYTDLVTEADHACQERIVEMIRAEFPDDGIVGEEEMDLPDGDREWIIDPIDGTTNFVHGYPFYCTSIGLEVDGEPVVGVVYNPVSDEMFRAVAGEGAELNGERIAVSETAELQDALVVARVTDWGLHDGDLIDRETRILHDLLDADAAFRRPGSAALDLCHVAAGRFDGQVLVTINRWDIAAGRLILAEAGGTSRVQDAAFDGYLELVASNGRIQDNLAEVIDRHVG